MSSSSGSMESLIDQNHDDQKTMVNDGLVDQRKRKRMLSNRESARRSRMRKQKHLDDLVSQVGELKKDNGQIITSINVTSQLYVRIEAENSILRAQMAELTNRLQSLNDIINCINSSNNSVFEANNVIDHQNDEINIGEYDHDYYNNNNNDHVMINNLMNNPWNSIPLSQPIMASADQIYMY